MLGGLTDACADRAEALYATVCDQIVRVSSPEAAELTKLLENIFRSVNIALVNELAMLTDRMGIDIWEVVEAASSKPYGFMRFDPGPGMGGHCMPVDPFYLSWRAREFDMATEFIELAGKVNQQMPYHCVAKAQRALNDAGRSVKGARIAILGVSYKSGVGDVRESPALKIISLLRELGAEIRYHDPHVPVLADFGLSDEPLEDAVVDADLVLIVTAHAGVDSRPRRAAGPTGGGPAWRHAPDRCRQRGAALAMSGTEQRPPGSPALDPRRSRAGVAAGRGRGDRRGRVVRRARGRSRGARVIGDGCSSRIMRSSASARGWRAPPPRAARSAR